ncbi:hypothetical protein EJ03DRAFT_362149 [Teratosphaeria nubilosa]|uniref:Metallo-beta-lactamase domain-containing protein n=1 Tax=Teratosphaeria nubilosa TaxID=161662 RepID=A0A6G1LA50_9PEZI|nr:hypothetical protein EJ03DRAFT_362149 [Teratosphaeria nubilosa]
MVKLTDLDTLEITVLIDNELDPISPSPHPAIQQTGGFREISQRGPALTTRGEAVTEMPMNLICCSAHGLSLMITGVKAGGRRHTLLFDTGPTEEDWEANVKRLGAEVGEVEVVHLSHWHRDHSGGLLRAVRMIDEAKTSPGPVVVDLHPDRPEYRMRRLRMRGLLCVD